MTKILLNLGIVITLLCVSCELAAQSDIALATRKAELQTLSKNLQKRDENDRRQAQDFARRAGIPIRRELPNGKVLELQRIAPGIGPIFISPTTWMQQTPCQLMRSGRVVRPGSISMAAA